MQCRFIFSYSRAGAIAPIEWIRRCIDALAFSDPRTRKKLLMGLNFYGYDYQLSAGNVEAITGPK